MSKSLGNVVNPDEIVKTYGADTLRVYEMFIGPFEDTAVWNTESIIGSRRFIEKVWRLGEKVLKQKNSFAGLNDPYPASPEVRGRRKEGERKHSAGISRADGDSPTSPLSLSPPFSLPWKYQLALENRVSHARTISSSSSSNIGARRKDGKQKRERGGESKSDSVSLSRSLARTLAPLSRQR